MSLKCETTPFVPFIAQTEVRLVETKTSLPFSQKIGILKSACLSLKDHVGEIPNTTWNSLDVIVSRIVTEDSSFSEMLELSQRVNELEFRANRQLPTRPCKPYDFFYRQDFYDLWVLEERKPGDFISYIDPPRLAMQLSKVLLKDSNSRKIPLTISALDETYLENSNFLKVLDLLFKSPFSQVIPTRVNFVVQTHIDEGELPDRTRVDQISTQLSTWKMQNLEQISNSTISLVFKLFSWS